MTTLTFINYLFFSPEILNAAYYIDYIDLIIYFLPKNTVRSVLKILKCNTFYFLSYSYNTKTKVKQFYSNAAENKFFHVTYETIFSIDLLEQLISDLFFQCSSFKSFAASYNFQYNKTQNTNEILNSKRLADAFFGYHLMQYFKEFQINKPMISMLTNIYLNFKNSKSYKLRNYNF